MKITIYVNTLSEMEEAAKKVAELTKIYRADFEIIVKEMAIKKGVS